MRLHRGVLTDFLPEIGCNSRPCVPQPQAATMNSSAQSHGQVPQIGRQRSELMTRINRPSHFHNMSLCDPGDSATTLRLSAPTQRIVAEQRRRSAIGGARAEGT